MKTLKLCILIQFLPLLLLAGPHLGAGANYSQEHGDLSTAFDIGYNSQWNFNVNVGLEIDTSGTSILADVGYVIPLYKRFLMVPSLVVKNDGNFDFGSKIRFRFGVFRAFGIYLDGRYLIDSKDFSIASGISIFPFFRDFDGDWIANKFDSCPSSPKKTIVNRFGCALDSDRDGVFDGVDRCSDTPFMAFVDSLGCPADNDNDGVFDGVDRCPDTPTNILTDSLGCPADTDFDGVPDYEDICPQTPENAWVDATGCPSDSDEDGVLDGIDRCQGTPTGFEVDRFGCPYIMPIDSFVITNLFDASLNLHGIAVAKIENLSKRIRAYPDRRVLLKVYTDSEGSPQYNYNRSSNVMNKVAEILLARGIDNSQFETKPCGESYPIASNASADGRKKNRRLEVLLIE